MSGASLAVRAVSRKLWLASFFAVLLAFCPVDAAFAVQGKEIADVESSKGVLLSAKDQALVRQALAAARKGRWAEGRQVIAMVKDPLAARIFFWEYYTRNPNVGQFRGIAQLIRETPEWPKQRILRIAAEKAMPDSLPDAEIIRWYRDYPPRTAEGMERYLAALQRQGKIDLLREAVSDWWRTAALTPDQQSRLYQTYNAYLTKNDHLARLNTQMSLKSYSNARAIARMLGKGYPALVEARLALAMGARNVEATVDSVPAYLHNDPGLMYERLRWRRANDYDIGAIEILHNQPPLGVVSNPEAWWTERQIVARRLMEKGDYKSAYLLVSDHRLDEGKSYAEAEFMSGWIALQCLKEPWKAFEHFEALYKNTETALSRSRGAYWAGRASDALHHPEVARQWYQVAAANQTTFYGQLAIARLDHQFRPPQQVPPVKTVAGQAEFNRIDMVQAARLLNQAGFRDDTTEFLNALSDTVKKPEQYLYLAELSRDLDHLQNAVRIAKKGLQKNVFLMDHAFPTILQRMRGVPIEWALVHALIRQESAFDYTALSPVGARGLMQLMPATAAETARKNGMSYSLDSLFNPDSNVRLGSAYLKQLLDRYKGSYPLALAAYNGGMGRVDRWLTEYGDPRTGKIDIVDWIEQIPISETRNYVQRVLEAIYIYRIKLHGVQASYNNAPIHVAAGE